GTVLMLAANGGWNAVTVYLDGIKGSAIKRTKQTV
ncbi:MAG: hypothetical protein RIQ79_2420, partial [Verrucomicrobiota bacterium]